MIDINSLLQVADSEQAGAQNILVSVFCSIAGAPTLQGDDEYTVSARINFLHAMVGGFIDKDAMGNSSFYNQTLDDLDGKSPLELTRESQDGLKRVVSYVLRHYNTM
jgi:hypothetical protein